MSQLSSTKKDHEFKPVFRDFYVSNRARAIDKNNDSINTLWQNKKKLKGGILPEITEPIIEAVGQNN